MRTLLILIVLAASSGGHHPVQERGVGLRGTPHDDGQPVKAIRRGADGSGGVPTETGEVLAAPSGGGSSAASPVPATQVGTALVGGTSTWYCHDGSGGYPRSRCTAGYQPGDLIAAAGSELPWGKGERVVVSRGSRSVVVTIVDVCACRGARVIDLSAAAFRRLGSLGEGVIHVEVTSVPALPETSTEEP